MSLSPGMLLKLPTPMICQSRPTIPHGGSVGELVVVDVVDLQSARTGVAQDHVGFAEAREIAEASDLPVQADRAHERDALGKGLASISGVGVVEVGVGAAAIEE